MVGEAGAAAVQNAQLSAVLSRGCARSGCRKSPRARELVDGWTGWEKPEALLS